MPTITEILGTDKLKDSRSVINDNFTSINDVVDRGVSAFIFRPGEPSPSGRVYDDFTELYADWEVTDGPKMLTFDSALGTCTIPAGVYDFTGATWETILGTNTVLHIADGVTITQLPDIIQNTLIVQNDALSAPVTITSANEFKVLYLQRAVTLRSSTAAPLIRVVDPVSLYTIVADKFTNITNDIGGSEPIFLDGPGANAQIVSFHASVVADNIVRGDGNFQLIYSSDVLQVSTTQVNHSGLLNVFNLADASKITFSPTPEIPQTDVQNAIASLGTRLPPDYIKDINLQYNGGDSITVNSGKCRDFADTTTIESLGFAIDINNSGVYGLDTGSPTSDDWYYVYVISEDGGANPAGLISLNAVTPTLPGSYTRYRRVGVVLRQSGSFKPFFQTGRYNKRSYVFDEKYQNLIVLDSGNANSLTEVILNLYCPPTSSWADLMLEYKSGVDQDLKVSPYGFTQDPAYVVLRHDGTTNTCILPVKDFPVFENRLLYSVTNDICWIYVTGHSEEL